MKLLSATVEMKVLNDNGSTTKITANLIGDEDSEVSVNHESDPIEEIMGAFLLWRPSKLHNFDFNFKNVRIADGHSS